ncbi:MAG: AAA family ATPase [Desulfovibrio sp.]|nr:AAA family ATPase [Desulfovibrio sp.]
MHLGMMNKERMMDYCPVEADRTSVLYYHVLKRITEDPLSFLKRILPNGRIAAAGVFHDKELRFRVFYEHHRNSHGNIGKWDRSPDIYAEFKSYVSDSDMGKDFVSLYAKVRGASLSGGMSNMQAIEELAKYYSIPCEALDNVVDGWKQVEIEDLDICNSIDDVKGYYQLSPQEIERRKYSYSHKVHEIYTHPNEFHRGARRIYDRDGKLMGLMFVGNNGQAALKTLWVKKTNGKKGEWHYSNFAKKPYPFDKTNAAFIVPRKTVYVIGDPALAEQFEKWQAQGLSKLKEAIIETWFGGKETVVDLDWEALKHHDLRVVIRETENDLRLAQAILEHVVGQHGLKSVSFYRYGTETVCTDTVLYSFDESRAFNLADDAFLYRLTEEDIYVALGLEERTEVTEEFSDEQDDSLVCIEGVLKRGAATMLYASDGVGKSMIALSVGIAMASGKDVFGTIWKVPARRRVLLIDGENSEDDLDRREPAFRRCYGLDDSSPCFKLISSSKERKVFDLTDKEFRDRLRTELFTPSGKRKVDILILDNWSALYSGDEDKAWRDVKEFLTEVKYAGIGVMFVNHASDVDPSKPDGYRKKNRFFDNRFYAVKSEEFPDKEDQPMSVRVNCGKSRSGASHTAFDLQLAFAKNQSGEERAFWLVNGDKRARDVFELRAEGKTYEEIGKILKCSKNTANDSIKENGHPDPGKWAKSK